MFTEMCGRSHIFHLKEFHLFSLLPIHVTPVNIKRSVPENLPITKFGAMTLGSSRASQIIKNRGLKDSLLFDDTK